MQASVKPFIFLLSLFGTFLGVGQDSLTTTQIHVSNAGFIYDWENNSTAFTNRFLLDLRVKKEISQANKEQSEKRLLNTNYYGSHQSGGIYYVFPMLKNTGLLLEAEAVSHQDATFKKDAYQIILNGNAPYRNQTKDAGGLFYRNITYQRIGVGLQHYFDKRTQVIQFTANLVMGDYFNQFKLSRGTIFTEQNGEYINLDMAYERHFSAIGAGIFGQKGYGALLHASWYKLMPKQNIILHAELKDLGFTAYPSRTSSQRIDTSIQYTGIDLGALNSISGFTSVNTQDSILNKVNLRGGDMKFTFIMPARLQLSATKVLHNKDILTAQAAYYLYNSLPTLGASYTHTFTPGFWLGGGLRVGGYGRMDIDLVSHVKITRQWLLALTVRSVEGWALMNNASGMGAFAQLRYIISSSPSSRPKSY